MRKPIALSSKAIAQPFRRHATGRRPRAAAGVAAALLVVAVVTLPGGADDRGFFRGAQSAPYVMMLLDTSESMTWTPPDGPARASGDDPGSKLYQAKSALYEVLEGLDSSVTLGFAQFRKADHEFRQKRWLYRRADSVTNGSMPWFTDIPFPQAGWSIDFGDELQLPLNGTPVDTAFVFPVSSTSGTVTQKKNAACQNPDDAGNSDAYRLARLAVYPKLGSAGDKQTFAYIELDGDGSNRAGTYEFTFNVLLNGEKPYAPGTDMRMDVRIQVRRVRWQSSSCQQLQNYGTVTIPMVPHYQQNFDTPPRAITGVNDYIGLHTFAPHPEHMYGIGAAIDFLATRTCGTQSSAAKPGHPWWGEGAYWEPNNNPSSDGTAAYDTFADPLARGCPNGCLDRGDLIPWDWEPPNGTPGFERTAREEVMMRMAPNLTVGETVPDFRVARYFKNTKTGGFSGRLQLLDAFNPDLRQAGQPQRYPPFMGTSFTPLGGMLRNFSEWYDDWAVVASDEETGDPGFLCREKFAILLTDGAETCNTDPELAAGDLRAKGIRTFVVGFGSGVTANDLDDIADAGGTGHLDTDDDGFPDCLVFGTCSGDPESIPAGAGVIIAQNRDELVAALRQVIGAASLTPSTFTVAAVPPAQANTQESIFLTGFTPLDTAGIWPGSVLHFVRPLPLKEDAEGDFRPDETRLCDANRKTGCLAWKAHDKLLEQAPTPTEVLTNRRIGAQASERRVSYSQAPAGSAVPRPTRLFNYPATADEADLWSGLGIAFTPGNSASEASARAQAQTVIRKTLQIKTQVDPTVPGGLETIDYVLGDSFHSDPIVVSSPSRFAYLANDFEGNSQVCSLDATASPGYRCYFERHRRRRRQLVMGSNDGQVHAFDAGSVSGRVEGGRLVEEWGIGTGNELFAHIPRPMLAHVAELANNPIPHDWGVDAAMVADDVFVDPAHSGTPTPSEREWRTVVIGGYREGGVGYFALDVTQPDAIEAVTVVGPGGVADVEFVPRTEQSYVPVCATNYTAQACGPLPYGSVRWEFTDRCGSAPCDDDLNLQPDLAFTWSKVNTGRVLVQQGDTVEVRYVAIFGGGHDPARPTSAGNFLYMVDIETGKTLYKRALVGSVPSEPAAVDTDRDGLLDTVYVGTTLGRLYKVDLHMPGTVDPSTGRVQSSSQWQPLEIFDTGSRPIYYPPTVAFVPQLGLYALAFGTGDREDLWSQEQPPQEGRFVVLLDQGWNAENLPERLTESSFAVMSVDGLPSAANHLLLPNPELLPGWILRLAEDEKVVTPAAAIGGLMTFNTFLPESDIIDGLCLNRGQASLYAVLATNGNAIYGEQRKRIEEGFVGAPYVVPSSNTSTPAEEPDPLPGDPFSAADMIALRESLKTLFPANCRFGTYGLRLVANRSDRVVLPIGEVPQCVVVKNWTEQF